MKTAYKIAAVCLVLGVCFAIGGGLAHVGDLVPKDAQAQASQPNLLLPFLVFCISVGIVVCYLILRSNWRDWKLVAALFVAMYGISTVAPQVETMFFLSSKMPPGMIRALFEQGAIALAFFCPLAVLILGKWKSAQASVTENTEQSRLTVSGMIWRIAALVVAFVFLYQLFGYFVAWQNPALRTYYGGTTYANFFAAQKANWEKQPLLYLLQVFRALLYIGCVYPLLRMLRGGQWGKTIAITLFLASWTTILLLPNPLMPASVAHSHFWETLGFNLVFGVMMGWLLGTNTT